MATHSKAAATLSPTGSATGEAWPEFWDQPIIIIHDEQFARALILRCGERSKIMQQLLATMRQQGRLRHARRMSRRYLQSFSARLHALARSYVRKVGSLRDATQSDLCELVAAAGAISAWSGSDEKAVAYKQPKRGSGYRWLHRHGMFQYALELLAADAAKPLVVLLPTQFITKGGIPKFADWLEQNIGNAKLVVTVDIPRCFDAIFRSSLADNLLLPKKVIKRVLFDPMDQATYSNFGPVGHTHMDTGPIGSVGSALRGVPQGSALSQLASEVVIGLVMKTVSDLHPSVRVASHGDNLIFLLEDASWKSSVLSALTSGIAKHFGSDVSAELTCRISCATPSAGFVFCRRQYKYNGKALTIRLPENWVNEFSLRTLVKIQDALSAKDENRWNKLELSVSAATCRSVS